MLKCIDQNVAFILAGHRGFLWHGPRRDTSLDQERWKKNKIILKLYPRRVPREAIALQVNQVKYQRGEKWLLINRVNTFISFLIYWFGLYLFWQFCLSVVIHKHMEWTLFLVASWLVLVRLCGCGISSGSSVNISDFFLASWLHRFCLYYNPKEINVIIFASKFIMRIKFDLIHFCLCSLQFSNRIWTM